MSEFPSIGIRPTIDGRERGVRESLEEQTMGMATSVAELLSSTLRYPDGTPVECIIADTTIGGIAEAAAAATKFRNEHVGLTITVTPCLVLRHRDHGHGFQPASCGVGVQRDRASRCGVPRGRARSPRTEGYSGLRHLR